MSPRILHALRLLVPLLLAGCPAVFPELGTRTRALAPGVTLDPPPPSGIYWVKVLSARVPEKTRGGRPWRASGKGADPYTKILRNDKELLRTPVQSGTLEPTWPDGPKGNFKIGEADNLTIELWDSNPINDKPICMQSIHHLSDDQISEKRIRIQCEEVGAEVIVGLEPAHAMSGAGLWYELRTESAYVTRLLQGSPAERIGIAKGDEIQQINGKKTETLSADEIRSLFNAIPLDGLKLKLRHVGGAVADVVLKEGPIYPLYDEFGPVD